MRGKLPSQRIEERKMERREREIERGSGGGEYVNFFFALQYKRSVIITI